MVLAQRLQFGDAAFCKSGYIRLEWYCGDWDMETIGQQPSRSGKEDGREVDFDLAASHLAARSMQTRVLWVCSTLGLAGIIILAVCLAKPNTRLSPVTVPALGGTNSSG